MFKKSVHQEFHDKADELMFAGLEQHKIENELRKEYGWYFSPTQVGHNLDRIVHLKDRSEVAGQKNLLFMLSSLMLIINIVSYFYSDGWATPHNVTSSSLDLFDLRTESLAVLSIALSQFERRNKIRYKMYMLMSTIFIIGNIGDLFSYMPAEAILSVFQLTLWISILVLNIIWWRKYEDSSFWW